MRDERSLGLADTLGFDILIRPEGIMLSSEQGVSHAVPVKTAFVYSMKDLRNLNGLQILLTSLRDLCRKDEVLCADEDDVYFRGKRNNLFSQVG